MIQATINKSIQKKFDKGIEEGKTYHISKFRIVDNNTAGKLTRHKCKIWFEYSTKLITVKNNVIHKQVFSFATFKDIIEDNITSGLCVGKLNKYVL